MSRIFSLSAGKKAWWKIIKLKKNIYVPHFQAGYEKRWDSDNKQCIDADPEGV